MSAASLRLAVFASVTLVSLWTDGLFAQVAQEAYLKASDTGVSDQFGAAAAISGNTIAIGANGHNGGSGAAYVFSRQDLFWSEQALIKASNAAAADNFGMSLAIDEDTLIVGAFGEDSPVDRAGAAYVFLRTSNAWSQVAYLKAGEVQQEAFFGWSVAVSGDTVVVGAPSEDEIYSTAGTVYVFIRVGATWVLQGKLTPDNPGAHDQFGWKVAVDDDTIVVGVPHEDSDAVGVNGDGSNNNAPESGAVYVFVRSGSTWTQQAYIKAYNTGVNDGFGLSLAISGDTVVVGATGEDSSATGVNGNGFSNTKSEAGAAYVFVRTGSIWHQQAYLKASNTESGDKFGASVGVFRDNIVVGAFGDDSSAAGVDGDQSNNTLDDAGAAHVFSRTQSTWSQSAYLKASNPGFHDSFVGVAISETAVVGCSPQEDSAATGVNGNQLDNSASNSGAAYVFALPCGNTSYYGVGCAGVAGLIPKLESSGCLSADGSLTLKLANGLAGAPSLLIVGNQVTLLPVGGGCNMLTVPITIFAGPVLSSGASGTGGWTLTTPLQGSLSGLTLFVQAAVADTASVVGFSLTNGVVLSFQ